MKLKHILPCFSWKLVFAYVAFEDLFLDPDQMLAGLVLGQLHLGAFHHAAVRDLTSQNK